MAVCKKCKNQIPDGSVFCMFCGTRQIASPRKKAAEKTVTVPKPRQLPSGRWFIQLRLDGESIPVTESTPEACTAAATAIKAKHLTGQRRPAKKSDSTLKAAIDDYLKSRGNVLSPSTIRTYENIKKNRFKTVMDRQVRSVTDWQSVIDHEAGIYSAKTLKTSWGLVSTVIRRCGCEVPEVRLPQIVKKDRPFLDPDQIKDFLLLIYGKPCELPALLALHSLRQSEIYGLTDVNKIDLKRGLGTFIVQGSVVPDKEGNFVVKDTNKNVESQRCIQIMIPRLTELLRDRVAAGSISYPTQAAVYQQINTICEKAGLPKVGFHGLRRSFVSLGIHVGLTEKEIMEIGGWSDATTVHRHYSYLSKRMGEAASNKMAEFYAPPAEAKPSDSANG